MIITIRTSQKQKTTTYEQYTKWRTARYGTITGNKWEEDRDDDENWREVVVRRRRRITKETRRRRRERRRRRRRRRLLRIRWELFRWVIIVIMTRETDNLVRRMKRWRVEDDRRDSNITDNKKKEDTCRPLRSVNIHSTSHQPASVASACTQYVFLCSHKYSSVHM